MPEWWRRGSRQNRLICGRCSALSDGGVYVPLSCSRVHVSWFGRRAVSRWRWGEVDWQAGPITL